MDEIAETPQLPQTPIMWSRPRIQSPFLSTGPFSTSGLEVTVSPPSPTEMRRSRSVGRPRTVSPTAMESPDLASSPTLASESSNDGRARPVLEDSDDDIKITGSRPCPRRPPRLRLPPKRELLVRPTSSQSRSLSAAPPPMQVERAWPVATRAVFDAPSEPQTSSRPTTRQHQQMSMLTYGMSPPEAMFARSTLTDNTQPAIAIQKGGSQAAIQQIFGLPEELFVDVALCPTVGTVQNDHGPGWV
ncbi:hypothetical protein SEUCBS140593_003657 [Sporothrix eucalyptigena]|uniref:Uncharacterized protein n=1 Tax=Sporothrix eucalyptigena TaxID=1812306 RepID=A0ABP0BGN7_9PEZI